MLSKVTINNPAKEVHVQDITPETKGEGNTFRYIVERHGGLPIAVMPDQLLEAFGGTQWPYECSETHATVFCKPDQVGQAIEVAKKYFQKKLQN